ncbi:MAG: TolB family protein, partial [Chloroflexota bacterium]
MSKILYVVLFVSLMVLATACAGATATPTVGVTATPVSPTPPAATTTPMPPTDTPSGPTATQTPASTPTPPDGRSGGLIAFYSDRDGNPEIYIMNPDGSDQRRL